MVIARHPDGTVVVMAHERGLAQPAMYAPDLGWTVDVPTAEKLHDFVEIEDEAEREALLEEARQAVVGSASRDSERLLAGASTR